MRTCVLISVKPRFARAILSGEKRFEFRRSLFRRTDIQKVIIYSSMPEKKVVGEFLIEEILSLEPSQLWIHTRRYAGIEKSEFDDYFSGKREAHAIKIKAPRRYAEPLDLCRHLGLSRPPQSFCYV
jgi:predicted transcriptional regulator